MRLRRVVGWIVVRRCKRRQLGIAIVAVILAGGVTSSVSAATYYVRQHGNDRARGVTSATAWRTVARVNRARLKPGDIVRFEGRAEFTDTTLIPRVSGTPSNPITYSSFGQGRAHLINPHGPVWFSGKHDLVFDRLYLSSAGTNSSVIAGSSVGSSRIIVSRSVITGTTGVGINAPVTSDAGWRIECNLIQRTGDSGIIFLGSGFTITGNLIRDTGTNPEIPYGKHGIYAKGEGSVLASNVIERFADIGLSLRAPNTQAINNTIVDGPFAIAFHDESTAIGSSIVQGNLGFAIGKVGFYFAPDSPNGSEAPAERFTITDNRFNLADIGLGFDIRAAPPALVTFRSNHAQANTGATVVPAAVSDARWRGCT